MSRMGEGETTADQAGRWLAALSPLVVPVVMKLVDAAIERRPAQISQRERDMLAAALGRELDDALAGAEG